MTGSQQTSITLFFEADTGPAVRPFIFNSRRMFRVGLLWFAVGFYRGLLKDLTDAVVADEIEWKETS